MELNYSDEVVLGDTTYTMRVATSDDALDITLLGAQPDGTLVADGKLAVPVTAASDVHQVLRRVFDGVMHLDFDREIAPDRARHLPGNNGAAWTEEADARLRQEWLAASPHSPAAEIIRDLAAVRDRTPGSIRSRLPRVGCDPETPGRELAAPTDD